MNQRKEKRERLLLSLFASCLLAVKLILMKDVKIQAITSAQADDELMVHLAEQLLQGKWLGDYNQFTLVKGCFFPIFLALGNLLRIDYISLVQICYAMACFCFVEAIRPMFKWKWVSCLFFLLLFFHPIMATNDVVQRVYRNSLTPIQVLFVLGGYIGAYNSSGRKQSLMKWMLIASIGLATMWLSREDGMWMFPFALIAGICILYRFRKRRSVREWLRNMLIIAMPFICVILAVQAVSLVNRVKYKINTDNEINNSAFTDAMKSLYEIDMGDEAIPYVSISREKIELVYGISPAMAGIQDMLDPLLDAWSQNVGREETNKEKKEVENGWFFWVFRDAAAATGYYVNGESANDFYRRVADEIQAAFRDGTLNRQNTMPSALMAPWRSGMLPELMRTMGEAAEFVTSCDKLGLRSIKAVDDGQGGIERFEQMTGRMAETEKMGFEESEEEPENRIMNRITSVWQNVSPIAAWIGRGCFLLLFLLFLGKKTAEREEAVLLITAGIAGSLICLYGGVSYNELSSCSSITELYLCGAYPIASACSLLAILGVGQWWFDNFHVIRMKRTGRTEDGSDSSNNSML